MIVEGVEIGVGSFVVCGVCINFLVIIGEGVIVNIFVVIEYEC